MASDLKLCAKCGDEKTIENFYCGVKKVRKHVLNTCCRECLDNGHNFRKRLVYDGPQEKRCARCHEIKSSDKFNRDVQGRWGLASYCKLCRQDDSREHRLRRHYGLTPVEYESIYNRQEGLCAAGCGRPCTVVDHNHATGEVRALMCHHCNVAIGFAFEDPDQLERLAEYVRRFQ